MPLNDAVPSSARDVATRNMQDLDKFLNGEQLTNNNRIGAAVRSIAGIQSEVNSAFSGLGYVPVSGSFESGGTVTERNEILLYEADGYYYKWAGTLPKVVAPASTPATAGGVGVGAWSIVGGVGDSVAPFDTVADADSAPLRIGQLVFTGGYDYVGDEGSNLYIVVAAATGTDDGGSFIDMSASGYQLKGLFPFGISVQQWGAHRITEPGYSSFDSQPAFDAMIAYCKANEIRSAKFSGKYNIINAPYTFTTPGDDGTVYPPWVGAGDANLTAETVFNMPVCLKIDFTFTLEATNLETDALIGDWSISSGAIDVTQKICLLVTAGSQYSGTIRYKLLDFAIQNFFIGRITEGIAESAVAQLRYDNCAIPHIAQGHERCRYGKTRITNCYAGEVFGGWWTQRNSVSQDPTYLPPYPATDIQALGWNDGVITEEIIQQSFLVYDTRASDIDTFFDTYFFKDSNSARTSAGGRLSNNDAPTPAVIVDSYRGIAGRARSVLSRYGRPPSSNIYDFIKVFGCFRTPIYYTLGLGVFDSYIRSMFAEKVGTIDPSLALSGNEFGIDNTDPYRTPSYGIGYQACYEIFLEGYVSAGGTVQDAPTHNRLGKKLQGGVYVELQEFTGKFDPDKTFFQGFEKIDGSNTLRYRLESDYAFIPPARFGSESGPDFQYLEGSFTPTLLVNGVAQTPASVVGRYKESGRIIHFRVAFFDASAPTWPAGNVTISGLPYPISSNLNTQGLSIDVISAPELTVGLYGKGYMVQGTTVVDLVKDSARTPITDADFNGGAPTQTNIVVSGWYWRD